MLLDNDRAKVRRVTNAFLHMKKFDIAALKRAFDGKGGATHEQHQAKLSSRTAPFEFVIKRVFDAPLERVWKAWTDPDELMQWWGPKGFARSPPRSAISSPAACSTICFARPKARRCGAGSSIARSFPMSASFSSIPFPTPRAASSRHPLAPDWPLQLLSTVTFTEKDGKTTVTVRWLPYEATQKERETFEKGNDSMQAGWTGTFDQLEAYLGKPELVLRRIYATQEHVMKLNPYLTFDGNCEEAFRPTRRSSAARSSP